MPTTTNESVSLFPSQLDLVLDSTPRGLSKCHCYIRGAAHIHGMGATLQEAVGNMVLTNPLLFNIEAVHNHANPRDGQSCWDMRLEVTLPNHPDHQWLSIGTAPRQSTIQLDGESL